MGPKQIAGNSYISFYKDMVKFCKYYFDEVVCTYPDFWESKRAPKEHYKFIRRQIESCKALVAEVSTPATGLGVQLQMAVEYKIPVIGIVRKGKKVSALAEGLPMMRSILVYSSMKELKKKLGPELARLK